MDYAGWIDRSVVMAYLVVFTPKSMLRLKAAASAARDFTEGAFQPVITDPTVDPASVRTVLLCSGKVYYDLEKVRELIAHSLLGAYEQTIFRLFSDQRYDRRDLLRTHLWLFLAVQAAKKGEIDIDSRLGRYEALIDRLATDMPPP